MVAVVVVVVVVVVVAAVTGGGAAEKQHASAPVEVSELAERQQALSSIAVTKRQHDYTND